MTNFALHTHNNIGRDKLSEIISQHLFHSVIIKVVSDVSLTSPV